ncbi:hypothetical protein BDA96_09G264100 [Sorghum bicolor]|uniref:Uncharacterized protein n=1 Tax=Sorghum bicolor TaxID=4558 RepID=A0A921QFK0_SORBI|nr:hypothetical protein BDA96_09G264100 [Sorghum bicolor]
MLTASLAMSVLFCVIMGFEPDVQTSNEIIIWFCCIVDEASEVRVQAKVADLIVKLKEGLNVWQTWRLMVLLRGVEGRSFGEMF